jgi:hypothetical protein
VGIEGNELVDKLAKEAAVEYGPGVYEKKTKRGAYKSSEGKCT